MGNRGYLVGYDPATGEARTLAEGALGEATPVYDEAEGIPWWDTVAGPHPGVAHDVPTFEIASAPDLRVPSDWAGVVVDGRYVTGTSDTPTLDWQRDPNPTATPPRCSPAMAQSRTDSISTTGSEPRWGPR